MFGLGLMYWYLVLGCVGWLYVGLVVYYVVFCFRVDDCLFGVAISAGAWYFW